MDTDWHSFLSSESGGHPDVFFVVKKEEDEEKTKSRWRMPAPRKGVWGEERKENERRMSKGSSESQNLPCYIPDNTLAQLTVKELDKEVENLGREKVRALKQRRRTLKNRGYAVKCRLRRQQYKDSLEMQVQRLEERLKKCEEERNFFREFYIKCCGQRHPLNLEMVNNNHEVSFILNEDDE